MAEGASSFDLAPASTVHISILVYKGSPVDYSEYRHTALWLRNSDETPPFSLVHIIGIPQEFQFEHRLRFEPLEDQTHTARVDLGFLLRDVPVDEVVELLERVRPENDDLEYNCHTWIQVALNSLAELGLLSFETVEQAINGMVDALTEAEDAAVDFGST